MANMILKAICLQEVGASQGLSALQGRAAAWSSLFSVPPVLEVLPAIRGLIRPPLGGPEVAQLFGPQLMASVGRAILSGDALQQELGMPLLVELCMALEPEGSTSGLPVILTAAQNGVQLAAYINSIVASWPQLPPSSSSSSSSSTLSKDSIPESDKGCSSEEAAEQEVGSSVAAAWVAVLCLPHANSKPGQIIKLLQSIVTKTASVLEGSVSCHGTSLQQSSVANMSEVLFLQCYARGVLTPVLESHDPAQLRQHLDDTLQLLSRHPQDFHVVWCAAEVAGAVTKGGKKLSLPQLQVYNSPVLTIKHVGTFALRLKDDELPMHGLRFSLDILAVSSTPADLITTAACCACLCFHCLLLLCATTTHPGCL